jgi:branched-chain amino acid transport system substrate-binding protein
MSKRWSARLASGFVAMSAAVALAACGTPGASNPGAPAASAGGGSATAGGAPYKVGLVYSKTGALAAYGAQYQASFKVGLDYATKGTNAVNGHPIEVTEADDAGDPAKAVTAATTAIGAGAKIIAGSTASGVALQVAPLAKDNKVLFISGPAATDAVTGVNKYTFRSGRQTYQDIATAGTMVGDLTGKKVTVFAQDSAFGKANEAGVKAVLGAKGATVSSVLVPSAATDATQMWTTLAQQGVFTTTKVVTGLDIKPTHALFGEAGDKISFLSHFFAGAADNTEYQALAAGLKKAGQEVDLFTDDGFVAAQMVVRALSEGGDDVEKMVTALEGWKFAGPKGAMEIRASDHAVLQPMFTAKLVKEGSGFVPQLVATLAPADVAPPAVPMK